MEVLSIGLIFRLMLQFLQCHDESLVISTTPVIFLLFQKHRSNSPTLIRLFRVIILMTVQLLRMILENTEM